MTRRTYKEHWTEVKRVVRGVVKQTQCCCKDPGASRRDCSLKAGNKNPCRCYCHDKNCHCGFAACKCRGGSRRIHQKST